MVDKILIKCGGPDERNRRKIVSIYNGKRHNDLIDCDSGFQRGEWRQRVSRGLKISAGFNPYSSDAQDEAAIHAELEAGLQLAIEAADGAQNGQGRWQPTLVCMADVESRPIQWLWPGRIALGRLSLLVGMPGEGKSFLTCDMAARISTGTPWPDGGECPRGSVLLLTAEDDPGDTIRPRLNAHHADPSRVHLLSGLHHDEPDGERAEQTITLADVTAIETALSRIADCRLVVIDPVGSFLGGRTDAHRDNEVRAVLAPIAALAERYGCAVLVVMHRRKSGSALADDTAMGSRAFTGIARSVWHLTRDADNRGRRLLLPGKANLTAEQSGLAFTIGGEPAKLQWDHDPVAMTADDAMAQEQGDRGDASALGDATAWLREALANGPRSATALRDDARRDGIAWRTIERAKAKLGVINGPDGFGGPWVWKLPACASVRQDLPESAKNESLAETDETVADSGALPLGDDDPHDREADWLNDSF